MKVSIRRIESEDNPKIQVIIQTILKKHGLDLPGTAYFDPQIGRLYEYYKEIPDAEYWVLLLGNEVIGGVGVGPFGDYDRVAELQKYYIMEDYQGLGYGRMLYNEALSFARAHEYSELYLETSDRLGDANQIYKHFGFHSLQKPLEGSEHGLMNRWFIKSIS